MAENNRKQRKPRREREVKEFEEVVLQIARVTRVVKGGRRLRFRATVVIGDKKGKVALGIGKSGEVADAIKKAVSQAKKDMITIPVVKGTIPHTTEAKLKSARITIMPAKEGKGIIAGGVMRPILDLAGIRNVYGKRYGTANLLANAQAVFKALRKLTLVEGQEADVFKNEKPAQGGQRDDSRGGRSAKGGKKPAKRELPAHTFGKKKEEEKAPEVPIEAPAETTEAPVEAPAEEKTEETKAE